MGIVDKLLDLYHMEWALNPYRIVDKKTKTVLFEGPSFDLRHNTLRSRKEQFDKIESTKFKTSGFYRKGTGMPCTTISTYESSL